MVDEQVTPPDLLEDPSGRLGPHPARRDHRCPRLGLELGPVERDQLPEVGLVHEAFDAVDVVGPDAEPRHEALAQRPGGGGRDLQPDDVAEAAPPELGFDRLEQVVGVVGELEVCVPRDPEQRPLLDLHSREERGQEVGDDRLERDEPFPGRDEPVEALGHLDARESALARVGVGGEDTQRMREPGDVRERLAGADGERCQHREDLPLEERFELAELLLRAVLDRGDLDARRFERGTQLAPPETGLASRQLDDALPDRRERLARREPVDRADAEVGLVELEEARDAHHEELVEVLGEDRGELEALQERQRAVLRDLEDARVVVEPRELAVEKARRGRVGANRHGLIVRERRPPSCVDPVTKW